LAKIEFDTLRWKNLLGFGNYWTEVKLNSGVITIISGVNGSGKCLRKSTNIEVEIEDPIISAQFEDFLKNK
jgi:hypothetical protein